MRSITSPRPSRRHPARAFTLLELLVAISITTVLTSLLLVAVQHVREASRRSTCRHHLRQIGLLLHQFELARTHLPPAALDRVVPLSTAHRVLQVPAESEHGWLALLLTYPEQATVTDRYQWQWDWRSESNREARERPMPTLQCPSTPTPSKRIDRGSYQGQRWQAAITDYAAISGVDPALFRHQRIDEATMRAPIGMLRRNELARLADNLDGLSQSLWIAEDAGRPDRYRARFQRSSGYVAGGGWPSPNNYFVMHGVQAQGEELIECPMNCTNDNEIYGFHPGGSLGLFGDGSVHWLASNLELRVLARLITIAAGEPSANDAKAR
ncbi:MAG: hypothetical protein RIS70_2844 [Planctomycetota bacterium]